jgi:hypothetical protein
MRAAKIRPCKIYFAKVNAAEFGATEIRASVRMIFPPPVPYLSAVIENSKLMRVRHRCPSHRNQSCEFDLLQGTHVAFLPSTGAPNQLRLSAQAGELSLYRKTIYKLKWET